MCDMRLHWRMSTDMPAISVVTIAPSASGIRGVRERVAAQRYPEDRIEVVGSTAEGIPAAWNEAMQSASNDLLVFTETDVEFILNDWLARIAAEMDLDARNVVHFGQVGRGVAFNFANLAVPRTVIDGYELDESFAVAEDTELFARMDNDGVDFEQRFDAPVLHKPKSNTFTRGRAYSYGYYQMRCLLRHGKVGPAQHTNSRTADDGSSASMVAAISDRVRAQLRGPFGNAKFYAGAAMAMADHLADRGRAKLG